MISKMDSLECQDSEKKIRFSNLRQWILFFENEEWGS